MAGLFFAPLRYRGVRSRSLTICACLPDWLAGWLAGWLSWLANAEPPPSIDRASGGRAKESDQNQIRSASRSRHSLLTRRMHEPHPLAPPVSFQDIHRDPILEKYVKAFKHTRALLQCRLNMNCDQIAPYRMYLSFQRKY